METKAGFVTIVGLPNAGKSTLMNTLLGEQLSIATNKPQTTRKRVLGILSEPNYQIVFLDTPGILKPKYLLQEKMMDYVFSSTNETDILLFILDLPKDPKGALLLENESVQKIIRNEKGHKILVINKIDDSNETTLNALFDKMEKDNPFDKMIPISAKLDYNVDSLLQIMLEYLPEHPKYFPDDQISDETERFFVTEIIRGKIFETYRDEIPYSTEVLIEEFKERKKGKDYISAVIVVERETQKPIIIGNKGVSIKRLGNVSRTAIEDFLQKEVFLELRVKLETNGVQTIVYSKISGINRAMNKSFSTFTKSKYFGELVMLIVTFLWGATFVIVKESLADISSMLFIAIRFSIALFFLSPIIFKIKKEITKEALISGGFVGLLLFGGFATQTVGLKFTTATKSGFLTGSAVVLVPIFQTIIEKKPTLGSIIGVAVVFIGILLLSSDSDSIFSIFNQLGSNFNIGDLLTVFCAAFFALYIIYIDVYTKKYNFWVMVITQMAVTSVFGFIFSLFVSSIGIEELKINLTGYLLFGLFYTSIFATLITTVLQTKYQKLITPTKASIIFSMEPVFAAFFAFFLLAEKITNLGYIGAVIIFIGLIISETLDNYISKNGNTKS